MRRPRSCPDTGTGPGSGIAGTAAAAPCRRSGRAGSASDARWRETPPATTRNSPSSTARTVRPGASPVRLATRKMCVSTAMVGSPNAVFSTTFAVLRPTPGRASSAARSRGTRAAVPFDEHPGRRDDVPGLGAPQSDRPDVAGEAFLAEREHRLRRPGDAEQRPGRLVDALVGRLRRQDHRDQELVGRAIAELGASGPDWLRAGVRTARGARPRRACVQFACVCHRALRGASRARRVVEPPVVPGAIIDLLRGGRLFRQPGRRDHQDAVDRADSAGTGRSRSSPSAMTVCMRLRAPMIASVGQSSRQRAQPMQAGSSIHATCGGEQLPHAGSSGSAGRPSRPASRSITCGPPGGQRFSSVSPRASAVGVGQAALETAAPALGLRQQRVDRVRERCLRRRLSSRPVS